MRTWTEQNKPICPHLSASGVKGCYTGSCLYSIKEGEQFGCLLLNKIEQEKCECEPRYVYQLWPYGLL